MVNCIAIKRNAMKDEFIRFEKTLAIFFAIRKLARWGSCISSQRIFYNCQNSLDHTTVNANKCKWAIFNFRCITIAFYLL